MNSLLYLLQYLCLKSKIADMSIEWKGVMPAVTTKFKEDDTLDMKMFEVNIKAQLDAGVSGIILGGTLGEASTLTGEEKKQLIIETVKIVDGAVPVIINIAEQTPMRYKANDYETITYFKAIANSTDLPIMIYNNPVDYGIEVTLDMFEEMLECKNIEAVKESTRDISNVTRIKARFGNRLKVLTGVDTLGMESILMGADGWVAGLVCAFPAETCAVYELSKAGRIAEALEIYRWFLPILELDINPQLVQNIKMAEVATGIGTERVRAPRLPLIGEERARVAKVISDGLAKRPKLPAYKQLNKS